MPRLLVTGSRAWEDVDTARQVLTQAFISLGSSTVLVHGGAKGADTICRVIWAEAGLREEVHRPNWHPEGVYDWRAGFIRNAHMVSLGADAALAFDLPCDDARCRRTEPHVTHGTEHCIGHIESAGIPLWRWSLSPH